jgi:hypothetical protein
MLKPGDLVNFDQFPDLLFIMSVEIDHSSSHFVTKQYVITYLRNNKIYRSGYFNQEVINVVFHIIA